MRALLRYVTGAVVAMLVVAGCGSASESEDRPASASHLTDEELAKARTAAREEVKSEDAHISAATATAETGTVAQPNTGYKCSSGRLLRITLIGSFPRVVAGGLPVDSGDSALPTDSEVHAMLLTADAATGRVCQIGVRVGTVSPDPEATVLDLG